MAAEFLISRGKFAAIDRAWRRQPVHAYSSTEEDIARYELALTKSGLTGLVSRGTGTHRVVNTLIGSRLDFRNFTGISAIGAWIEFGRK